MIIVFVIILNTFFAFAISDQVRQIAIERTETTNALYLNSLALSDLKLKDFEPQNFDDKKSIFMNYYSKIQNEETVRLKVWAKDGTIVYSDDENLIGQNFIDNVRFQSSINGEMTSEIKDPVDPENISEVGYGQLMEIYVPII